jgi:hypothetical protein
MKQISIFILLFVYFISIHAQDTINLKNKKVIHANITEKSDTKIKYKTDSIHADTTYSAKLSGINSIYYQNGEVDHLSSQNPRSIFPLGINYGVIVAAGNGVEFNYYINELAGLFKVFTGSIDYLVTPKISAEASILVFPNGSTYLFSLGGKYWLANKCSKSGFSPFLGLFYSRWSMQNYDYIEENSPQWSSFSLIQVPIGISYITKFGLQTSLQLDSYSMFDSNSLGILNFIELRIGWRFKTTKKGY